MPSATTDRHPLTAKLERHGALPAADRELLGRMLRDVRSFRSRRDVIGAGEAPEFVHLVIEGWACRYAIVRGGGRQITALLMPGDFCDLHVTMLGRMDHGIAALGLVRVAFIDRALMAEVAQRTALTRALWWAGLVDEGVLRAWIVNLGRHNAVERVAHLFSELHARATAVGIVNGRHFRLPLTQADLGDALGLTAVHVNRVLRTLREDGLVSFANQLMVIEDIGGLQRAGDFDPSYLHLRDDRGYG